MLITRIFFGALMIAALVGLIALDDHLAESLAPDLTSGQLINVLYHLEDGGVVLAVLALLIVPAAFELRRLMSATGAVPAVWPCLLVCLALLAIPFLVRQGLTPAVSQDISTDYEYTINVLTFGIAAVFVAVMARRKTSGATAAIGASLLTICYLGLLPQYLVRLRMWAPSGAPWLLLYAIGVIKVCDIGAYFTGRSLGRHKLIEWLSPKKTIEGLAGGVATSMLVAVGVTAAVHKWGSLRLDRLFPTVGQAAVFGLLMALIGQTGDLVESLFKRDAAAKDSAATIPAFGGVLDVLDSILLTAPVAFWMLVK